MDTADGKIDRALGGGGDGQPGEAGIEFLFDAFCASAMEALELVDGLQFTVKGFNAPAFAIKRQERVARCQVSVGQGGQHDHLLAALVPPWPTTAEAAGDQADGHGQRRFVTAGSSRQDHLRQSILTLSAYKPIDAVPAIGLGRRHAQQDLIAGLDHVPQQRLADKAAIENQQVIPANRDQQLAQTQMLRGLVAQDGQADGQATEQFERDDQQSLRVMGETPFAQLRTGPALRGAGLMRRDRPRPVNRYRTKAEKTPLRVAGEERADRRQHR